MIFIGIGILVLVIALVFFGAKLLVGFSLLVEKKDVDTDSAVNSQELLTPPILDDTFSATNEATLTISGFSESGKTVSLFRNGVKIKTADIKSDRSFIFLNVELENNRQIVEVSFRAIDAENREIGTIKTIKFGFNNENQAIPRFWSVYSSDTTIVARYQYQVRVIVKGGILTKGMEWFGPWVRSVGNGPLMISVPTPEDEGVTYFQINALKFSPEPLSSPLFLWELKWEHLPRARDTSMRTLIRQ